jgi:hypothetical protein
MGVKNFLAFGHFLPNFVQIDQIIFPFFLAKYEYTPLYSKFNAKFKFFYRIQFAFRVLEIFKFKSARSVNFYCNT